MKIQELLNNGISNLKNANIEDSAIQARVLLCYILKCNKQDLIIKANEEINIYDTKEYIDMIDKVISGKPLQYLINNQEFMKMNFYVDENVLIPQPDTEILVEQVIKYSNKLQKKEIKILDLCTGSGAIAVSLAKYIQNCDVYATDISNKALQIAKLNAERNCVHKKIIFIESDMFNNIDTNQFDIIVSNPPYIKTEVIDKLDMQVQNEPYIALDGGKDGLKFYKEIINNSYKYLTDKAKLFLEIGFDQKEELLELLKQSNQYENFEFIKDFSGNDRVIIINRK